MTIVWTVTDFSGHHTGFFTPTFKIGGTEYKFPMIGVHEIAIPYFVETLRFAEGESLLRNPEDDYNSKFYFLDILDYLDNYAQDRAYVLLATDLWGGKHSHSFGMNIMDAKKHSTWMNGLVHFSNNEWSVHT